MAPQKRESSAEASWLRNSAVRHWRTACAKRSRGLLRADAEGIEHRGDRRILPLLRGAAHVQHLIEPVAGRDQTGTKKRAGIAVERQNFARRTELLLIVESAVDAFQQRIARAGEELRRD